MSNEIFEEIKPQLENGKGCIIFDFGFYYPYKLRENENVIFEFKLGETDMPAYKLNHRYNNKAYYTITRKKGRGLYKCGYPYFFDIEKEDPFLALLCLKVGVARDDKEEAVNMIFPIKFEPTKERPVLGLSMNLNYDDGEIMFTSYEKLEKDQYGYGGYYWSNRMTVKERLGDACTLLIPDVVDKDKGNCIFVPPIEPKSQILEEILL